jgi:WD40 repeat protein
MTLSTNARYLAMIWSDPNGGFVVKVFDYQTTKLIKEFIGVTEKIKLCDVYPMAFSPDSKYFAVEKKGKICLYNTGNWKEKWCVRSFVDKSRLSKTY